MVGFIAPRVLDAKKDLAHIIDVQPMAISKYTSSQVMPSIPILANIAKYFNVTVDYLVGESNYPYLTEKYGYFKPIESVEYEFTLEEGTLVAGSLDYIFGVKTHEMNLEKDEFHLEQFLCFKFGTLNQSLYDALFLDGKLLIGYFLYDIQGKLGLPIMRNYGGPFRSSALYVTDLIIWNEERIKPPRNVSAYAPINKMERLSSPKNKKSVRLNYTYSNGDIVGIEAEVHLWLEMNIEDCRNMLMRRLRKFKS